MTPLVLQPLNGRRIIIANLILAAIYIAAGRFGLSLAFQFPSVSPVWPPSGIALAALIIFGQRLAPGVLIGATIVNATTPGTPFLAAALIAIGNTLEGMAGSYLVANYARGREAFNAPRDIIKAVFLAAICATTISATIGVTSVTLLGSSNWAGFRPIWLTWWLGDAVSIVVLTPFLLLWFGRPMPWLSVKQLGEVAAAFVILGLIGQLVFQAAAPGLRLYHFLTVPPLLWIAYRFGRRGASLAVLALSAIAITGTVRGLGPFALRDANESLLLLQAFIGTLSVTVLVVAAAVAEQKEVETALHAAQEQLRAYTEELEGRVARRTARLKETVQSLESFSYSIAHDLRAPVRSMAGFAKMLQEDYGPKLDADAQKYIGRILDNAARMDRLILDLLAYGKMTHMDLPLEPLPLEPVIRGAMEQLSGEIAATGAKINLPASLPQVTGNRTVLEQVFANLLGNALKFIAPGVTPQIEITSEMNGGTVCVRVRDNGIGVPPGAHDRIFNVFERAHANNKYAGTGIGLAIVRKALERLGGRVGVESEPGRGSCFWIELPAA